MSRWLDQMISWGPFQPKLFCDSVKMRSIIKSCLRLLQKWSGLWPTLVFWSQNLDSTVKTIDKSRVKDLHSVISWEATRSAETCAFLLTLPPMRSLTDTILWRGLCWISHIPCCSTLGFSTSFCFSFWSVTQMSNLLSFNSKGQTRHLVSASNSQWLAAQTTQL